MRTMRQGLMAVVLVLTGLIGVVSAPHAMAQDATPGATPCAATTPAENTAVVVRFLNATQDVDDAAALGDAKTAMDVTLSDDVTYDIPGVANVPGNDDEIAYFLSNASQFVDFSYEIVRTVASDDVVAVNFIFHVNEQQIPGATPGATASTSAAFFARVTCGQISQFTYVIDTLSLLVQLGLPIMPPAATPAP